MINIHHQYSGATDTLSWSEYKTVIVVTTVYSERLLAASDQVPVASRSFYSCIIQISGKNQVSPRTVISTVKCGPRSIWTFALNNIYC